MNLTRLTPENAHQFIGHKIRFQTRGQFLVKEIRSVSPSGHTIYIDHPDLNNCLQIKRRIEVL